MQSQTLFLEEWLKSQSSGGVGGGSRDPSHPSQPATARAILQAWSDIRNYQQTHHHLLLDSLRTLLNSKSTLHVADPQAKLLLSILSSTSPPLPPQSHPLLYKLLYTWIRKSHRPSPLLLKSAVEVLSSSHTSYPEEALLLGAIAAVPWLPETSRRACLDRLCCLLEDSRAAIGSSPELVLAGIGYALSRSTSLHFSKIAILFLGMWSEESGFSSSSRHGLIILGLMEWLVIGLINSRSMDKIESLCREVSVEKLQAGNYARFVVVMFSIGILRAFRRVGLSSRLELSYETRHMLEGSIINIANHLVSRIGKDYKLDDDFESHLLVQCISLGLARCGPFPPDGAVLRCVCFALLNDVFPLSFFAEISDTSLLTVKIRDHLDDVLFREAGGISGVLCNQYASTNEENMSVIENEIWEFSQEFYMKFRTTFLALKGRRKDLLKELEKMAESIFLMVVVFAAAVAKQKMDAKSSYARKSEVAANILVAFSCIEYLRRVRWPEYTDVVRRAVLILQENESMPTSFVDSMPSYDELGNGRGSSFLGGLKYVWSQDEVQTARILFYLRVIPTCIGHIPTSSFRKKLAPIIFLYMCHPNVKVSEASHSVFVAFMSSGKDSNQDDQMELKEQLVFYYTQRSLEAYPELTPYKGMAAGVSALVRYLPAGSPAIFYCISSLVEKTTSLLSFAIKQDPYLWKNWQGDSEPCKKVLELLLHLVSIVDIQVLPNLLKLLAQFIIQLPKEGQKIVLDEIYTKVAESDDVVRKPTLVSWLHSLSYLSSQEPSISKSVVSENDLNAGALSFVRAHSRL